MSVWTSDSSLDVSGPSEDDPAVIRKVDVAHRCCGGSGVRLALYTDDSWHHVELTNADAREVSKAISRAVESSDGRRPGLDSRDDRG